MTSQLTIATPTLLMFCCQTRLQARQLANFDISVTSPLNTHTRMEARVSAGYAALATEGRRHRANDTECGEPGWLCVPLVAETYGAWGNEAIEAFSQQASQLATLTALSDIYGRLNCYGKSQHLIFIFLFAFRIPNT